MLPSPAGARHERSKVLEAVDAALADPVRLMRIVAGSADEADASRRISQEWALDDEQTRAVMDLQVRRVTAAGRAIVADELRVLRAEWGPTIEGHAHFSRRGSAVLAIDGTEHSFRARGVHGVLDQIREFAVESLAVPRLRPVTIRITGLPEGPTRMTCTPARHGSFEYPEEQMAPTPGG